MGNNFKVGDRVRRKEGEYIYGLKVGEEGVVNGFTNSGYPRINGWGHVLETLELVTDDKPAPAIQPPVLMNWADVPENVSVFIFEYESDVFPADLGRRVGDRLKPRFSDSVNSADCHDYLYSLAPIPATPEPELMPWDAFLDDEGSFRAFNDEVIMNTVYMQAHKQQNIALAKWILNYHSPKNKDARVAV